MIPQKKGEALRFARDEHPRETTLETFGKLKPVVRPGTARSLPAMHRGDEGACALLLLAKKLRSAMDYCGPV